MVKRGNAPVFRLAAGLMALVVMSAVGLMGCEVGLGACGFAGTLSCGVVYGTWHGIVFEYNITAYDPVFCVSGYLALVVLWLGLGKGVYFY